MKTDIIVYHGGCQDGITATWCFDMVADASARPKCIKGVHGKSDVNESEFTDKVVVFVDFIYPMNVMLAILEKCKYMIVIDHHETSIEICKNLAESDGDRFESHIDLDRCAAQIAWDLLMGCERPWFIDDIGDRDLWKWTHPDSYYSTRGMDLRSVKDVYELRSRKWYVPVGKILSEDEDKQISNICHKCTHCVYGGAKVSLVFECPYAVAGPVSDTLLRTCDAVVFVRYDMQSDTWRCSARGENILELFKQLGAAGHQSAAGFTVQGQLQKVFTASRSTTVELAH
jgi:hypothetical protein